MQTDNEPRPVGRLPAGSHPAATPAKALPLANLPAGGLLISGDCLWMGFAARESSTLAGATLDFIDGGSAAGYNLGSYAMAASGRASEWFGPQGILVGTGLSVVINGVVTGAVYFIDLRRG